MKSLSPEKCRWADGGSREHWQKADSFQQPSQSVQEVTETLTSHQISPCKVQHISDIQDPHDLWGAWCPGMSRTRITKCADFRATLMISSCVIGQVVTIGRTVGTHVSVYKTPRSLVNCNQARLHSESPGQTVILWCLFIIGITVMQCKNRIQNKSTDLWRQSAISHEFNQSVNLLMN